MTVWPAVPMWALVRSREEFGRPELPLLTVVSRVGVRRRDLTEGRAPSADLSGYRVVRAGDLVVNKLWARFGAYGVAEEDGVISPAYWVLRLELRRIVPRYLHHVLQSAPYRAEIWRRSKDLPPNGYDLAWGQFRTLHLPTPSLVEQQRIADFLDRESSRITSAIGAVRTMRDVAYARESDVVAGELSSLPRRRFGFAIRRIEQGWSPQCDEVAPRAGEWGVLKVGCVNRGFFDPVQSKRLPSDLMPREQFEVCPGDLLVSRANTPDLVGSAAVVTESPARLLLSDKTYRIRLEAGLDPRFFVAALGGDDARAQIAAAATGASSSMQNVSQDVIRNLVLPYAAPHDQARYVAAIRTAVEPLAEVGLVAEEIRLALDEYRDALITEAVTGQLDVSRLSESQMDESLNAASDGARPEVLAA